MNILHIYKDYYPVFGGVENHVRQLAEAQTAQGHSVTVLVTNTTSNTAVTTLNGVRVIKTGRQVNVQSAPLSAEFPIALRRESAKADIAHLHAPYPPGEAFNLWFGRAHRTVITWHSDIVRQKTLLRVYAPVLRQVIKHANCIIPTSETYARSSPWLRDQLGKCAVIPLSVDTARFNVADSRSSKVTQLRNQIVARAPAAGTQPIILLSVGRLRYYKGLDDLIRAMPQLPNAIAVIAGAGPMELAWKSLAQATGVADRVLFAGEVGDADLPAYYHAADIYVLPANERAEAFGIAILEAMACGLPIVCTEVGTATSWINQHNVTGLVVPAKSPDALTQSILKLQQDPGLRTRMGVAASQRVLAEFTQVRMVERILDVYRRVLAR